MKVFLLDKGGSALPDALYDGVRAAASALDHVIASVERPVFVPLSDELDADELTDAARALGARGDGVVVELTVSRAALAACSAIYDEGVPTNVTGVTSVAAAMMAAKAQATFVTVQVINDDSADVLTDVCDAFDAHDIETEILAEVSRAADLDDAVLAGVHGVFTSTAIIAEVLT